MANASTPLPGENVSVLTRLATRARVRGVTGAYIALLRLAKSLHRVPRSIPPEGADILLTGTFHSHNWVRSHIKPLADSHRCRRIRIVATNSVPDVAKVEAIYPPDWMIRTIGRVPARLTVFLWEAIRTKPHVMGAFHLLFNGMITALLARLLGTRSMYFCVGGPAEVLDGGLMGENRFYSKTPLPDPLVERWLIEAVASCDLVVTMGSSAARFFRAHGLTNRIEVISGGIASTFTASTNGGSYDAILVGRLAPIKRIDIFIRAIGELARTKPNVRALIVGDGALRGELEQLSTELGLTERITFAGQQSNVEEWLRQAKVFVLTSDSEGLALSLMEAMTCGLPGVVSSVGDLGDLVSDGLNGYLVAEREPQAFAARIATTLEPARYPTFSAEARRAAKRYEVGETTRRWDDVLAGIAGPAQ